MSRASTRSRSLAAILAIGLLSLPAAAAGQGSSPRVKERKWTIEGFGGFAMAPGGPDAGPAPTFDAGPAFPTEGGFTSRENPSWYFGDGAALFNEVAAQFGSRFGIEVPRVAPLDPALRASAREAAAGAAFGARVTRQLTRRVGLELAVQSSRTTVRISDAARTAIEATSASYESGFTALLGTIPQTGLQVSSSSDIDGEVSASQTTITGALKLTLHQSGRFGVYATAGAGRTSGSAETLDARLRGSYEFRFFDLNRVSEQDSVTLRFEEQPSAFIGVLGGGFTLDLGVRHGVRVDVRAHLGRSESSGTLDAVSSADRTGSPITLPSQTTPSIQFSNAVGGRSSLAGRLSGFEIFRTEELQVRPLATIAYFIRF